METVKINFKRGESFTLYDVPYKKGISALWALRYIYENLDPGVAYPLCLCKIGKCGSCALKLDGKPVLSCSAMLTPGEHTFESVNDKKVIRDLVIARGDK
ncbi:hypothetical protein LJC34_05900 [Oscillospiraceae bacterium OttesenSCG-928-G22]|nr:hypothetical protein [Oscillospiraceae bacterium OttesenSCG-928-G22]